MVGRRGVERVAGRAVVGESAVAQGHLTQTMRLDVDGRPLDWFAGYDAGKGSFRTFLRACLDGYMSNERKAAGRLNQLVRKADTVARARILLATVKGDVHDIGKNLVDIILTNNGFKVVNLGIKQPGDSIIRAADEHGADGDEHGLLGVLVRARRRVGGDELSS